MDLFASVVSVPKKWFKRSSLVRLLMSRKTRLWIIIITKKPIWNCLPRKNVFSPEHKKKVASTSHCTWFYFKCFDKARPRSLSRKYINSRIAIHNSQFTNSIGELKMLKILERQYGVLEYKISGNMPGTRNWNPLLCMKNAGTQIAIDFS